MELFSVLAVLAQRFSAVTAIRHGSIQVRKMQPLNCGAGSREYEQARRFESMRAVLAPLYLMSSFPIDITIAIAHRDNADVLVQCLKSIYEAGLECRFEVIVVDNASKDHSREVVEELFPDVRLIVNTVPKGYGASNNQAFEQSRGEYFFVINNDTLFREGCLDAMLRVIRSNERIGCLGCRLLNPDGSLQPSCSSQPTLVADVFEDLIPVKLAAKSSRFRSRMYHWDHDEERAVDVVLGACMLFRREVFEAIDGFDEQFYLFREEVDICRRVVQTGYLVWFTPSAEIVHLMSHTVKGLPAEGQMEMARSRLIYYRKHHGRWQVMVLRVSRFAGCALRLIGWIAVFTLRSGRRSEAKAKARMYLNMLTSQ